MTKKASRFCGHCLIPFGIVILSAINQSRMELVPGCFIGRRKKTKSNPSYETNYQGGFSPVGADATGNIEDRLSVGPELR